MMNSPFSFSLISLMLSQAGGLVDLTVDLGKSSEAILPCISETGFSPIHDYYSWQQGKRVVYSFDSGRSQEEGVDGRFRGRGGTGGDHGRGDLSLRLWNLTARDEGAYACYVFTKTPERRKTYECEVRLLVVANSTPPEIHKTTIRPGLVLLSCVTDRGYPMPVVNWTSAEGLNVSALTTEPRLDPDTGLWRVSSSTRVSAHAHGSYTCTVTNTRSGHSDTVVWRAANIPEATKPSGQRGLGTAGIAVTSVLLVCLVLCVLVVLWMKQRRNLRGSSAIVQEGGTEREKMETDAV